MVPVRLFIIDERHASLGLGDVFRESFQASSQSVDRYKRVVLAGEVMFLAMSYCVIIRLTRD